MDPPARNYLYNAYPMGIVTAQGSLPTTVFPYYLQLVFPDAKLAGAGLTAQCSFYPPIGVPEYERLGYIKIHCKDSEAIEQMPREELVQQLIAAIERYCYIYLRVNEFYIPQTSAYLRWNFRHALLLYGYDGRKKIFLGATYRRDGSFGPTEIPIMLLVEGLLSPSARIPGAYNAKTDIRWIERAIPSAAKLERDLIGLLLTDYVQERNSVATIAQLPGVPVAFQAIVEERLPKTPVGAFGLGYYRSLRMYISQLADQKGRFDVVVTKTLWEHKKIVRQCLNACCTGGFNNRIPLGVQRYGELMPLAQKLHLAAYTLKQSPHRQLADEMASMTQKMEQIEKEALIDVLNTW